MLHLSYKETESLVGEDWEMNSHTLLGTMVN